jgi:adenine C2-methylase RlmN of 23S rRNA A2503 and tRNA A37
MGLGRLGEWFGTKEEPTKLQREMAQSMEDLSMRFKIMSKQFEEFSEDDAKYVGFAQHHGFMASFHRQGVRRFVRAGRGYEGIARCGLYAD